MKMNTLKIITIVIITYNIEKVIYTYDRVGITIPGSKICGQYVEYVSGIIPFNIHITLGADIT